MNKFYKISYIITTIFSTVILCVFLLFYLESRDMIRDQYDPIKGIYNATKVEIPAKAKEEFFLAWDEDEDHFYLYAVYSFKEEPDTFLDRYNFTNRKLSAKEVEQYELYLNKYIKKDQFLLNLEDNYEVLVIDNCYFLYSNSLKRLVFNGCFRREIE